MSEFADPMFERLDMKTIQVEVEKDVWGVPKTIIWWDGRRFPIHHVGPWLPCPSRVETRNLKQQYAHIRAIFIPLGNGEMAERTLIDDDGVWFVEVRK